jgi:ketosteroid isomerase-like protein
MIVVEPSVVVGVQATIAAYAQALDAGRTDDLVELFCPDGVSEIAGTGTFQGREEIRAAYTGFQPSKPQRHLVANTVVTSWEGDDATAVSDLALLRRGSAGWVVALAGRYEDTMHRHDGVWLFRRRITTLLP